MSSQEGKYRKMVTKNVSSKIVDKIKQLQAHSLPTFPSFPEIPSYEECMRRSKEFWENFTFFSKNNYEALDRMWSRGKDFLGTKYAIMGGAMSWLSERHLVSAISNGGGFGIIASGGMKPDILRGEIQAVRMMTSKPFGVNIITMHRQLEEMLDVCIEEKVTHIVFAGGVPSSKDIKKVKDAGIKVICFAPTVALGKKLIRAGSDALLIEGSESGGHIGPVSTLILAQEIIPHITEVPIFVAGGVGTAGALVSFLEMGASGCQIGSRFVCATECIAHPNFKKAFIRAHSRDAMPMIQIDPRFPVISVRALSNEGTKHFIEAQKEAISRFERGEIDAKAVQDEIEHFWVGALKRAAIDGDVENGSVMAGQSVGLIDREMPAAEIIENLVEASVTEISKRRKLLEG